MAAGRAWIAAEIAGECGGGDGLRPAGYWITWGGQFENLAAVPGCFFLIFLLLYAALGSPRDALLVSSAVPLAITGGVSHCGYATCRFSFRPRSGLSPYPAWRC
jgi:heavy metal efflux system protein